MKKIILICLFIPLLGLTQSDTSSKSSFIFEIGGNGGFGSINYERNFLIKDKISYSWRAGFSFSPVDANNGTALVFPIAVNALIGQNNHKLELGVGQGITLTTKGRFFALGLANIGYRFQKPTSPFFYRATYTPLISYLVDFQVQQWGGISIGYTFN